MRCVIAGRPSVTNMYESIIWVSFAVSFFGMIFFARYRTPVYLLAALPVSLVALLLVHQMPIAMPSSIDPLVPVLRDNRSEEHTSELQSRFDFVCRLLLEK